MDLLLMPTETVGRRAPLLALRTDVVIALTSTLMTVPVAWKTEALGTCGAGVGFGAVFGFLMLLQTRFRRIGLVANIACESSFFALKTIRKS